jgi:GNAT superfamily N-acetyltransferase
VIVRSYRPSDLDALYDICVRTADAGGDARGQYYSDLLMGDLFAAPYAVLEPEHAHVLDDGTGRAVGYIVGTADTARFVRRYRAEWVPRTLDRCPPPNEPPRTADDHMLALHHHPEHMIVPALAGYPAHLHIDLLPDYQRKGWGRRLMARFIDGLHTAGVPGVYLSMLTRNRPAYAFYKRVGFTDFPMPDPGPLTYLVRDTSPLS